MSGNGDDFSYLADFLESRAGIELDAGRRDFAEAKLHPLIAKIGCGDLSGLVRHMRSGAESCMLKAVIDLMTTNESLFFRDSWPFEMLHARIFPDLMSARAPEREIRIWSAACATGQEPYSIAMTVDSLPSPWRERVRVLATDLCEPVLRRAQEGVFSRFEVSRGLSQEQLQRFFDPHPEGWRVRKEIRERVEFKELNLMDPYWGIGEFDVVFCRNVLIYFSPRAKERVLSGIRDALSPNGFLVLGGAETLLGYEREMQERWQTVGPSIFRKAP